MEKARFIHYGIGSLKDYNNMEINELRDLMAVMDMLKYKEKEVYWETWAKMLNKLMGGK